MTDHTDATRGIVDLNRLEMDLEQPRPAPEDFAPPPRRRRKDRNGNGTSEHLAKVGELASEGIAQAYKRVADDIEAAVAEMENECKRTKESAMKVIEQLRQNGQAAFDNVKACTAGVRRLSKAIETSTAPATDEEMEEGE